MTRVIERISPAHNESDDAVCYIPLKKHRLKFRANFALHVFIARTWNESKKISPEKRKTLVDLISNCATHDRFFIPAEDLNYILKKIMSEWFNRKDYEIEISSYESVCSAFLYLCGVLHGGGEWGKKLLASRARYLNPQEDKKEEKKNHLSKAVTELQ